MTNEKPPRGRPRPRPRGFDDVPELSPEEVERRVDVRGGGTLRAPVERAPRAARPARAARSTTRDSLFLVGLVVVGLVAVRVLLPDGPLTATATNEPAATEAAVVPSASTASPVATSGIQTLVPVITLPPGSVLPSPTITEPTPTVVSGQTPKPGQTPRPTARVTAAPTSGPTAPNRATVIVKMVVIRNSGGATSNPADWTVHVSGEASSGASQNDFPGSASGTAVTIPAGQGYRIRDDNAYTDYAPYPSPTDDCYRPDGGGGLAAGTTVTCTITRDDRPRINVTVTVNGGPVLEGDVAVTVTGGEAKPPSLKGSGVVVVGFGLTYSITAEDLPDYDKTGGSGACSGSLPLDAAPASCTFTYDYVPTPAPTLVLPLLIVALLRPRRWRTTATG